MSTYLSKEGKSQVEAFQFGKDEYPKWFKNRLGYDVRLMNGAGIISVLIDGHDTVYQGDYILKHDRGNLTKMKEIEFNQKYRQLWKVY